LALGWSSAVNLSALRARQGLTHPTTHGLVIVPHRSRTAGRSPALASAYGVPDLACPDACDRPGSEAFDLWRFFTYIERIITMSEQNMTDVELAKVEAEIASLNAMTAKLHAETMKLNTENRWYLLIVGSGATLAIVAVARLFLG
jgi:hypothetical protein